MVALDQRNHGNEAEVIIHAALVGQRGGSALQVRVEEKTSRRTVLSEVYPADGTIRVPLQDLQRDLKRRYGRRSRQI